MLHEFFSGDTFRLEDFFGWTSPAILQRGRTYFAQRRVTIKSVEGQTANCTVRGSGVLPYSVTALAIMEKDSPTVRLTCTCPYASEAPLIPCKHKIAVALALQEYCQLHRPAAWKTVLSTALAQPAESSGRNPRQLLLFSLQQWGTEWRVLPYTLALSAIPNVQTLTDARQAAAQITHARVASRLRQLHNRTSQTAFHLATPAHIQAANLLAMMGFYYSYSSTYLEVIIPLLKDALVFQGDYNNPIRTPLTIIADPGTVTLELEAIGDGMRMSPTLAYADKRTRLSREKTAIVSAFPTWLVIDGTLLKVDTDPRLLHSLLDQNDIVIPEEDTREFVTQFLEPLAERLPIRGGVVDTWDNLEAEPVRRVYLTERQGTLQVALHFGYGDHEVPYDPELPAQSVRHDEERKALVRIQRNVTVEQEAWEALGTFGLKRDGTHGLYTLRGNVQPVDFLLHQLPKLQDRGYEVFGEESLPSLRINRSQPTVSMRVATEIDWFDVQIVLQYGELEVPIAELRRAFRKHERFVRLPDGSLGQIPQELLAKYQYLLDLGVDTATGTRLSKSQVTLLDQALAAADQVQADDEYLRRCEQLRNFTEMTRQQLPDGFCGELRPYQQAGFDWLHFLHDYEFGGCLADDMGIGKTVQTLVFLQSLIERGHAEKASLIVMPRSLLVNWQREAERFTPNLRVLIHADNDRLQNADIFNQYDLILTTYGIMRRDLELLREYRFHYLVLDEAQAIKNPLAQTARAARLLIGDHRLALTGTPVENSTTELWSLFAFLNPGLLGSVEYFRKTFATPIERHQNQEVAGILRSIVYPFILRRTKEQVAPELPTLTNRILYCEMETSQRKLYTRWRDQYRALLLGLIDDGGLQNARMKVLEGLLRLRQLCIHPCLVDKSFKGDSTKFEMLMETLETLRAEGHKALIFSQFTQMLKLVREELDTREIPYLYLDGQTKDRQERVDQFQQDSNVPFFLISLKAGGLGLNLTAADYVIHLDPWWNPAVERQATDRTHRIGQDNPVMVYKLIARDSVEEKMLQLQERKQALVDQLISTETSFMKSLTREDVTVLFS